MLLTLSGLLVSTLAWGEEPIPRKDALRNGFYVAPLYSQTFVDEERGTADGTGYALALGYRGSFAGVELIGADTSMDNPDGGATELTSLGLNLLVAPLVHVAVLRDLNLMLGFAVNDRQNHPGFTEDDETYFIDAGLAYTPAIALFGIDVALRADYLYRRDTQQPVFPEDAPRSFTETVARIGLQIPLSKQPDPPTALQPVDVAVVSLDDDGDGVFDASDECPGTAPNQLVDAAGCVPEPPPAPPPTPPCETSADRLQLQGCEVGHRFVLDGLSFASDRAELDGEAIAALQRVLNVLRDAPDINMMITGYTDDRGADGYNQELSERRAEAVREYLMTEGIASDRLRAAGAGEADPVTSNNTEAGRANNRRIEFRLMA